MLAAPPAPLPTTRPKAITPVGLSRQHTPVALRRAPSQPDLEIALTHTERIAAQVAQASHADPFAAAAVAYRWLGKVEDVQPSMFDDPSAQRAWAEAWCVLDGVARSSRRDSHLENEVARYLASKAEQDTFDRELGADPVARLEDARGGALQALRIVLWHAVLTVCLVGPTCFLLIAGLALGPVGAALLIAGRVLSAPASFAAVSLLKAHRDLRRANAEVERVDALCEQRRVFLASARGGRFLSKIGRHHPLVTLTVRPPATVSKRADPATRPTVRSR
jgi:hypothetical protein